MKQRLHPSPGRRGSVIIIVLWAIAVAAIITSSVQLFSQRQATLGRESLERVQARWAARAGIENTLAVMTFDTEKHLPDDARALSRDMYYVSKGDLIGASYDIVHQLDGRNFGGPMDEHAKTNINVAENRGLLMVLDDMTLDVADAVGDWLDTDNDVSPLGVERDYYQSLSAPYTPRNGPMRSIGEMELIAGVWPKYFRGEDWNLNGRLDPNENNGARSFPPDNADGVLDGGWAGHLTVYSVAGGATGSGQPRIYLKDALSEDLETRLAITPAQAEALITFGKTPTNSLTDLIFTPLGGSGAASQPSSTGNGGGNTGGRTRGGASGAANGAASQPSAGSGGAAAALTDKQIRAVLAETSVEDPLDRQPGKMNINSVPAEYLRDVLTIAGLDDVIIDEVVYMRDSQVTGISSMMDLKKIPKITSDQIKRICQRFDVVSNVFTISSRGRSWASGTEVEIVAVVDRSTVPVRIIEYREQ